MWLKCNGGSGWLIGLLPRARRRCSSSSGEGRRRGADRANPAGQPPQLGAAGRDSMVWAWRTEIRWLEDTGWAVCTYVCICGGPGGCLGVSVDPSVVGRDWSPASFNKARPWLLLSNSRRPPSPKLQPRRAARRYLRVRGTSRDDSRGPGVWGRACAQAASASCTSCRAGSV
jgi:hypothetical protein